MIVASLCKMAVAKVVDCKCVYEEKYGISEAKYDPATQICCQKSGVRERFKQGQEMDCCGEIYKETEYNRTHICCKKSGVHDRYQEKEEVDCCKDGVYKWRTEQCSEKNTFQKEVKTCGNNSEISKPRKDTSKLPGSRIYLPLHQQCRNEVVQLLTERFGDKGKKIRKAISRIGKALRGESKQKKQLIIISL